MPETNKTDAIGNYKKDMVLRKYEHGKISISKASEETGLTVGEIEDFMVRKGCRSKYSTVDLEIEMELLESKTERAWNDLMGASKHISNKWKKPTALEEIQSQREKNGK